MADTSRRSSEELEPDLSTEVAPKKFKRSESSDELPVEQPSRKSAETSSQTRATSSQAEITLEQERDKQSSLDVAEAAGTPERSALIGSETSAESSEQLIQINPEFSERGGDIATVSAEAIPSTSQGVQPGILRSIVMRYNDPEDPSPTEITVVSHGNMRTFSLQDDTTYEDLSIIGNGAYGTVYKAKDRSSGQVVALKKVRIPLSEDGLPVFTLREIAALKSLEPYEHPNIVKLLDVCQGEYLRLPSDDERSERPRRGLTLWLVFEHVERDLSSYIDSYRTHNPRMIIPPNQVRQMTKELLNGVDFLHSHRILHRDLKPQNLLVTQEGRIKIADFGLAKTYDFEMRLTSLVVTQWYRAPEVLLGCSYATPVDIWSIGCIFAELCKLEPLFPGTSEGDQLDRIFQVVGTPTQEAWPENVSLSWTAFPHRQAKHLGAIIPDLNEHGLNLIKYMLMFDPHSRLTASQALRHRYFIDNIV